MNRLFLRPGFKFRDGRLIVSTDEDLKIINSWPDLKAICKPANRKVWVEFIPVFRLLRPKSSVDASNSLGPANVSSMALDTAYEKHLAFTLFRHAIPLEIVAVVEQYTNRQWRLLALCRQRAFAKDLLHQNPALGFGMAHVHQFCPLVSNPLSTAVKLSAMRQRDILGWLNFPKSQAWVNILAKIPHEAVTLVRLKSLREAAAKPEMEAQLQHLRSINGGVIDLVTTPRFAEMVGPTLLAEIAESSGEATMQEALHLLNDIINLGARMNSPPLRQPIRSLIDLRKKQQKMVEELAQFLKRQEEKKILPPPPLPGTSEIVPLTSTDDLAEESKLQHNCVAGYAQWVNTGKGYIYRILTPERATLSIVRGADGCWCIDQLKLACNKPASYATCNMVLAWLNQFSLSV